MKIIFLIFLAALIQLSCTSREIKEKQSSLTPVIKNIKSIDPKDEDFSDLQFLKKIIERDSVQVILLGEQTHGDGSTFLAKTRLIKFLHKEAGFDVLAFESGLFDCTNAWSNIRENKKYIEETRKAVFPLWSGSNECAELLEYLQSTLNTANPVELTGIDPNITGNMGCQLLIDEFISLKTEFLSQGEKNLVVKIICLDEDITSGQDKTYNNLVMDKLINGLDSLNAHDPKFEYWKYVMEGVKTSYNRTLAMKYDQANASDSLILNARDIQMGKNLSWLVKSKYKNRKVIVWAAGFHTFRRSGELRSVDDKFNFINGINKKTVTAGDILYDALGSKMYCIGFTQYTGKRRNIQKNVAEDIPEHSDLSIENIIASGNNDYAFIDLRDADNPDWVKGEFVSGIRSGPELKGKWKNVTDGIFYIKEMQPSTFGNEK